jgi:hypothetical protein
VSGCQITVDSDCKQRTRVIDIRVLRCSADLQAVLVQQTLRQSIPRDSATLSNTSKMFHENDPFVDVQVSTVDAFQGMEKNIILL